MTNNHSKAQRASEELHPIFSLTLRAFYKMHVGPVTGAIAGSVAVFVLSLVGSPVTSLNILQAQETPPKEAAPRLLAEELPGGSSPGTMVRDALLNVASVHFDNWQDAYDRRSDPADIAEHQRFLKQQFIRSLGGLPERAALDPEITGVVSREGYSVEKVLFQSQPDFYVTAALFLPDPVRFPPPWPAVVVLCGHSKEGKLQDGYQRGTALAAINGLAAILVDPIGQGERLQILDTEGQRLGPTTEHTLVGTGAILVGWNTARWMIHDAMRAIDYLESRGDILADRIGVMGNSGGGTQTAYLMALDERVAAAAPSCYITSLERLLNTIGPQDAEQNLFGQIAWGMDHADTIAMRSPKPTLIACATRDFFDITGTWATFRHAKRLYHRLGAGRNVELVEVDAEHGWHPSLRQASVQFMLQHLAGRLEPVDDPEIKPLSPQEMQVTSDGQVLRIPGARSTFDHVRDESQRLAIQRAKARKESQTLKDEIRQLAGIRSMNDLPMPQVETVEDTIVQQYSELPVSQHAALQPVILKTDDGVWLPGVLASPKARAPNPRDGERLDGSSTATCLLLAEGFAAALADRGEVQRRVIAGESVLAIDIRGVGESTPVGKFWYSERFGRSGGNSMIAYLLGQSLVGLRTEDCLVCSRWLANELGVAKVNLVASGELTVAALHAAALHPEWIDQVELRQGLSSWAEVANTPLSAHQIPNVVHGALRTYDLPELAALIGDRLKIEQPHDARDMP